MKRFTYFVGTLAVILTVGVFVSGCASFNPGGVPEISGEPTPLEGTWRYNMNFLGSIITNEYTFTGNQYTWIFDTKEGDPSGNRGVFRLIGDRYVEYRLEKWDSKARNWTADPEAEKYYISKWFIANGDLTLRTEGGEGQVICSKEDNPLDIEEITFAAEDGE